MCRNLIFASVDSRGSRMRRELLESLLESAKTNDDGFALYALYPDYETLKVRTLSLYEYVKTLLSLEDVELLLLHTHQRAATMGSRSVDNVHLWESHGLLFSHNGFVFKYYVPTLTHWSIYSYTGWEERCSITGGESDSRLFFTGNAEEMRVALDRGDPRHLQMICERESLSGIVMVNDVETGRFMAVGVDRSLNVYINRKTRTVTVSNTPIYNLTGETHLECEWIYGTPGTTRITFKKSKRKQKAYTYVKGIYPDYWYD